MYVDVCMCVGEGEYCLQFTPIYNPSFDNLPVGAEILAAELLSSKEIAATPAAAASDLLLSFSANPLIS